MSTSIYGHTWRGMARQMGEFLAENLDHPGLGWPRINSRRVRRRVESPPAGPSAGLRVLVIGDLTLELPVEIEATRSQLLAALRGKNGDAKTQAGRLCHKRIRWKMAKARVGGFVAHAAPVATALGASVTVATAVPIPMPDRFEAFFEQYALDRRFVSGVPGPCPVTILLCCTDGTISIRRRSICGAAGLNWPTASASEYDVILADPCHPADRKATLGKLAKYLGHGSGRHLIGLRIGSQWARSDLGPTHDERIWSFVRREDAQSLLERFTLHGSRLGRGGAAADQEMATHLHDKCGIAKLVLQLGSRGAVLVNGIPCPYHVHACPMKSVNPAGSGDMLLAVTTLSSAWGADDRTSLRRGVAAATGHVAGLDLPHSLEELDAA